MSYNLVQVELKNRDRHYTELLNQWKKAISKVTEGSVNAGLSSYTILTDPEEQELCFSIFGIRCFMRFRHDLEHGVIEYGVLKRDDRSGNVIRIPITDVGFDYLGNLSSPYTTTHIGEYDRVHLLILGKHSAAFVKAAYDKGETE